MVSNALKVGDRCHFHSRLIPRPPRKFSCIVVVTGPTVRGKVIVMEELMKHLFEAYVEELTPLDPLEELARLDQ